MTRDERGEEFLKIKTWEEYWERKDEIGPLPVDKRVLNHLKQLADEAGVELNKKPANFSEGMRYDIF